MFCIGFFHIGIMDVCHSHSYAEILSVEQKDAETVVVGLKSEGLQLRSPQAPQITHVMRLFLSELTKVPCLKNCLILQNRVLMQKVSLDYHTSYDMKMISGRVIQCNVARDGKKITLRQRGL